MTKIDIISGFLGAGKTTLINRLIKEAYNGEKVVLIENEFGEIGIDGGFLKDAGIEISEMNSGCICCSLVGDFSEALKKVKNDFAPDRILIEPSGVGKLSDIVKAVESASIEDAVLNSATVVVDVNKCKMYMKNFGEFFNDQISNAGCIIFSHTDKTTDTKLSESLKLVREKNATSTIITTPYDKLNIKDIIEAIEKKNTLDSHIKELMEESECPVCGHHHHHHDEECDCHEHHHHHHADDVFDSWGVETAKKFSMDEINNALKLLESEEFGIVLRAKGIVDSVDGDWIYFDYIPSGIDIRRGNSDIIGKLCVIGSNINKDKIKELFNV